MTSEQFLNLIVIVTARPTVTWPAMAIHILGLFLDMFLASHLTADIHIDILEFGGYNQIDSFRYEEVANMINYDEAAKIFKALGDSRRLSIIDMISNGEICACVILEKFKFSQSTLSHHMKLLCNSGLIIGREQGKWTYYSVNKAGIEKAMEFLSSIVINEEVTVKANENCC